MLMTITFGLCLVTAAGTLCYNSKEKLILFFSIFYLFIFGCVGSSLQYVASLLQCVGFSVVSALRVSGPMAYGVLAPRPGMDLVSFAWKVDS